MRTSPLLIRFIHAVLGAGAFLGIAGSGFAVGADQPELKHESFDKDPNWEGFNNRVVPKHPRVVKQDFGYSATNHAGRTVGEMGGVVQRSTTPASYAAKISPKTLDDHLAASGSFAITKAQGGAGVFFGFFNSQQPGGSGRPIGSLGFDFDFEQRGGRLAARLISNTNKSCGTFLTPYLPGKFRPTPIKCDGTRYDWSLDYDPNAHGGDGQFTITLTSDTHRTEDYGPLPEKSQQEALARFPNTTKFVVDLPPGFRREGATFDRFGLMNMMKAGGSATIYFDGLSYNGKTEDFTRDPHWIASGNRTSFEDLEQVGAHNFGYSAETNIAGGAAGEVGGGLWRSGDYAYYADRVGPLSLNQKLEARGKVRLVAGGPDSDIFFGWFSSESKESKVGHEQNFVGVHIGGPTRIGHYFAPAFATAKGSRGKVEDAPVLVPGQNFQWSLVYDPQANRGNGELIATLGEKSVTLPLKRGHKAEGAQLDRFGFFTTTIGGQMVKIYFDDLDYTVAGNK
jgi:hypothetical protein